LVAIGLKQEKASLLLPVDRQIHVPPHTRIANHSLAPIRLEQESVPLLHDGSPSHRDQDLSGTPLLYNVGSFIYQSRTPSGHQEPAAWESA
jgi:hypothetical protein